MNTLQQEQTQENVEEIKQMLESIPDGGEDSAYDRGFKAGAATARAEGAKAERKQMLNKIASCFSVEKEGDIGLFVVEHTGKLVPTMPFNDYEALTTKEHHAS